MTRKNPELIKRGEYLIVSLGDSIICVYKDSNMGYTDQKNVDFKTQRDYRNFMRDLRTADDDSQSNMIIEGLLKKAKVE